ncbi:MAG: hypothetical protein R3212_04530, partial [Xanthomonadales bacterium]|nr:hypothetical protein [Xanthomonadales bacterium]
MPFHCFSLRALNVALLSLAWMQAVSAAEEARLVERDYRPAPPAPAFQTAAQADVASAGCVTCHTASDQKTMHASPAVVLGCADCHGGDATVRWTGPLPGKNELRTNPQFQATLGRAHVLPRYPDAWHFPSSANPRATYTLLNREAPEFIRFVNPSDYR